MAVAIVGEIPNGNAQMDQSMMEQLGVSPSNPPAGGLARLGGPAGNGYRILSVWESEDAWNAFKRDKMEPYFQGIGQPMPAFEVWRLDTFLTPQK